MTGLAEGGGTPPGEATVPGRARYPEFATIVPAKNAAATIGQVLTALQSAAPAPAAIVVFADGCSDNTAEIARSFGVTVIEHNAPSLGPAAGRNHGAAATDHALLTFVDADVVVEPDAFAHLIEAVETHQASAAFGAYTTLQVTSNLAARYTNLRHHFFHVNDDQAAETFWTGLGLVRREAFDALGGFDAAIGRPAMEDIEFGFRLRRAGHTIRIAAQARGTHLKNWTVGQLWRDDIWSRAVPWSGMIIDGLGPATLNASVKEQIKAGFALLFLFAVIAALLDHRWLMAALAFGGVYAVTNFKFSRKLRDWGGNGTMLAGIGLHFAYYLYSSFTFLAVLAHRRLVVPVQRVLARPDRSDP